MRFDSIFTDEGIDGAEGVTVVAGGIDVLVDDTTADIGNGDGCRLGGSVEATRSDVEAVTVISVT